jgi:hypothetical protein
LGGEARYLLGSLRRTRLKQISKLERERRHSLLFEWLKTVITLSHDLAFREKKFQRMSPAEE